MYNRFFKRFVDILCAVAAIVVFCWLYVIVAVLVRVKLGSPVIFCQERPGKNEKIFRLYKFRTMTDERDENGELLPDNVRLTKFGKFLRSTSLDELPEAFNILKGDMSVVGPRPMLVRDMVFMTSGQRRRHSVRPGLTGLAQVSGRNNLIWEKRLETDLVYIEKITFLDDVKIILKTITQFLGRDDVNTDGMDTSEDLGDYLLRMGMVSEDEYVACQAESKKILEEVSV